MNEQVKDYIDKYPGEMKKLYEKSELWFALAWIIVYCVLMSVGDNLSAEVGVIDAFTLPIALCLSVVLLLFLKKNSLFEEYGLCKAKLPASKMLYYIPILILLTANLWYGVGIYMSILEIVLYILTMFCVGFLEEVIFRGLLFNAMLEDNVKAAIVVSSLTFGMGHIIRLFNGSGTELIQNLLQVIYASAIGFVFVLIYYKTKSLLVCIAAHSIFNALSVFINEAAITMQRRIISCIFLVIVSGFYAIYLALTLKKEIKK